MGWSISAKIKNIAKMIQKRPDLCIISCSILFVLFRFWIGLGSSSYVQPAKPPTNIFNDTSYVYDVYTGNLEHRDYILHFSEVSFVLYYAPWCHKSMLAAEEFAHSAKEFYHQVTFVAVNCWWNQGDCRKTTKRLTFPLLHLYHKSKKGSTQYNGPLLSKYYREFLNKALLPVTYLGTSHEVDVFIQNNQISIIFYCDGVKSIKLKSYLVLALSALEKYPENTLQFGLVLSRKLSSAMGLKKNVLNLYDSTQSTFYPASQMQLNKNTNIDVVLKWATSRSLALKQIYSTDKKSNKLHKIMKTGSTVIAFITSNEQLETINNVAILYHKQNKGFHCCQTFHYPTKVSICLKSSLSVDSSTSCAMYKTMLKKFRSWKSSILLPQRGKCIETKSLYDVNRHRFEICAVSSPTNQSRSRSHVTVDGLANRSNMTLNFIAMDYKLTPQFAHILGHRNLNRKSPFTVIANLQQEQYFYMTQNVTKSNLEQFILDYSNHLLTPTLEDPLETEDSSEGIIQSLSTKDFEAKVLASSKDVLLYYHADWCGGCMECSHALSELTIKFEGFDKLLIYEVKEQTNNHLPLAFKAISYPTIILFPGNRTSDSVVYSSSTCSYVNLVDFLLHNASSSTRAQILLDLCSRPSSNANGLFQYPICKQQEVLKRLAR